MSIADAVEKATQTAPHAEAPFKEQIEHYQRFAQRMADAGVQTKKQHFTIPLMDRIACRAS